MASRASWVSLSFAVTAVVATGLFGCSTVFAGNGSWNVDADGNWSSASNWNPATVPGTAAGDVVALTNNATAARTVTLDSTSRTVGTLLIGDPVSPYLNYTLNASGGASLTFNNSGSDAKLVQTNNTSASDTLSVPLALTDNLTVTNRATLTLSGVISGTGKGITKTGTGTLILAGANTYGGPTWINGSGPLQLGATDTLPVAGAVILGGTNNMGNLDLGAFSQKLAGFTALSTSSSVSNLVTIGAGQTLVINGTNGLLVGIDTLANNTTKVLMTGGGALVVTNASAYVTIGKHQVSQNYSNTSSLDLSALSSVTLGSSAVPVNEIRVAYGQTCTGTLTLSNTNNLLTATNLQVGNSGGGWNAGTGNLILGTGSNVLSVNTINIGVGKAAGMMKFASQSADSPGTVSIGGKTGGTADFNIGCKSTVASGAVPNGTLDLRGHAVTVAAGTVTIGKEDNSGTAIYTGGGTGSLLFDSGSFSVNTLIMAVKSGPNTGNLAKATATLTIGGGTFTVNGGPLTFASQTGAGAVGTASATLNLNGGTFRSYADIITGPSNCTSTINLNGGTLDMTGRAIGLSDQQVSVLNANAGTLMNLGEFNASAPLVKSGSGALTLAGTNTYSGATVLTGGTLTLGDGCLLGGGNYTASITNNAALVFNNSVNQTLSGVISGSGTLAKSGSGALLLAGTNTYAGATAVTGGKLVGIAGGALLNSDITVSSGAMLGVRVLANEGQWSCKSLTLGSGTTTAEFRFYGVTPSTTTAPLFVGGSVVNNGTLNILVGGTSVSVGTYPLIRYSGPLTVGTLGSLTLPTGAAGTLVNNTANNTIDLAITTASAPLVWAGGSGDWDTSTANWASSLTFLDGDLVRFDDTSSGTAPFTVNLAVNVNPGSVTVDNPTKDYALSGPGTLGGPAGLIKRGAGTLTLTSVNTSSGGMILDSNAGTVKAFLNATQDSLGTGPVMIGSGSTLVLTNRNTSGSTVLKASNFAGTGVLKLDFAANTTARSTALPGLSGFAGTVQVGNAGSGTGDKLDASGVVAPGAAVQIADGNTLLVGNSYAPVSFSTITVRGTGNAELYGAIRIGAIARTLAGAITLLGDTTLASDTAGATLTGPFTGTAVTGATNILTQGTTASTAGCTLSGAISDGTSGGKVALTQTKGTLILSGANTYSGLTTVYGDSTVQLGATDALPVTGAVILGGSNSVGNLVLGSFGQTLASLTAISTPSATDQIIIGAGQTLVINGNAGLYVGTDIGVSSTTQLKMTGGGALVVTNASAIITVGKSQLDEIGRNDSALDLSGLSAVVLGSDAVPINEIRIAYGQYCPGAVILSNTSNLVTAATLNIGNSNGFVPSGSGTMTLGAGANVLAVDKINIGQSKGTGMLGFSSQAAGSPGTVTIGGKAGGVADLSIGDKTGTWTGSTPVGTLDLRGHVATVAGGTVTIGKEDYTGVKESGATGNLYFDAGIFTATNLVMGLKTGFNTGVWARASGTLTVSGGVFTVTDSPVTLASQTGAGFANATLNLLGGTFRSRSDILTGPSNCTSTINLDGGTLDMTRHVIGLNAQTVTVFNARSGTLMNLAAFNNGAPLVKTGVGTLTLDGTNTYAGATIVSNGVLRLTGGACLPPTADLYLYTGGTCQLDYTGSLFIHALYVDGVRKMGSLYGQEKLSPLLSGTGYLELSFQGTLIRVR